MNTPDACRTEGRLGLPWLLPLVVALLAPPRATAHHLLPPVTPVPAAGEGATKIQVRGTVVDEGNRPVAGATVSGVTVRPIPTTGTRSRMAASGLLPERTTDADRLDLKQLCF